MYLNSFITPLFCNYTEAKHVNKKQKFIWGLGFVVQLHSSL